MRYKIKVTGFGILGVWLVLFASCNKKSTAHTAFYSWKSSLELDTTQKTLLKNIADNHLYLRLFDVVWNEQLKMAVPEAVVSIRQSTKNLVICPVIYITNKTFEHTNISEADTLALKVNRLADKLAEKYHLNYSHVQIDCDWTSGTKDNYFAFLRSLKKYSHKQLEATIRLHQIKYPDRTGVPPADKGLLMFYNMGKLSADPDAPNSIYNAEDAQQYVGSLSRYPLKLDIALPLFSWSIQTRAGRIIQLYGKISKKQLSVTDNFEPLKNRNVYRARKSFYLEGIYVKTDDLFKLEEITAETLHQAARQASKYLAPLENRNIIYYEISSVNFSALHAKDIPQVSAHF